MVNVVAPRDRLHGLAGIALCNGFLVLMVS